MDQFLEKGSYVFCRCINPDVGIVSRVAKDGSWADVRWLDNRPSRIRARKIERLNPVLNFWLQKDGQIATDAFEFDNTGRFCKHPKGSR